jgi:molybdenum cofactor synthesis domain-containing protein
MKQVKTEDAVGMVLCHDITKIVPGEFKGTAFKKGHVVTEVDVPELLKIGKSHLYVWEQLPGFIHEEEAAQRLATAVAGPNISFTSVKEGKVSLTASVDGLLKVDRELLEQVNNLEQILLSTRHSNTLVKAGEILAGTRVVPLVIEEEKVQALEVLCRDEFVVQVKPLRSFKVGLITTGSEVFQGKTKDAFGPVIIQKLADLGSEVINQVFVPDDLNKIVQAIEEFLAQGVDMIAVSGGMSVDPDDLTPGAIKAAGAEVVGYGVPVLPGNMFMLGYFGDKPIVGLPGCVMYSSNTVFDLILPRLLVEERITRQDLNQLAYGGLCLNCPVCQYPVCPFGKA